MALLNLNFNPSPFMVSALLVSASFLSSVASSCVRTPLATSLSMIASAETWAVAVVARARHSAVPGKIAANLFLRRIIDSLDAFLGGSLIQPLCVNSRRIALQLCDKPQHDVPVTSSFFGHNALTRRRPLTRIGLLTCIMTVGIRALLFQSLRERRRALLVLLAAIALCLLAFPAVSVAGPTVLYSFTAPTFPQASPVTNSDGIAPASRLVLGLDGNLYGTTRRGGA